MTQKRDMCVYTVALWAMVGDALWFISYSQSHNSIAEGSVSFLDSQMLQMYV